MNVKIATQYENYQELLLDLDVYGRLCTNTQLDIEGYKDLFYEEFKKQKPMPSMEHKRYNLSRIIDSHYCVEYKKELELRENEIVLDLNSYVESNVEDIADYNISDKVQELFSYENQVTDLDRQQIIEKYSLDTGDLLDVERPNNLLGTIKQDESLRLDEIEIANLSSEIPIFHDVDEDIEEETDSIEEEKDEDIEEETDSIEEEKDEDIEEETDFIEEQKDEYIEGEIDSIEEESDSRLAILEDDFDKVSSMDENIGAFSDGILLDDNFDEVEPLDNDFISNEEITEKSKDSDIVIDNNIEESNDLDTETNSNEELLETSKDSDIVIDNSIEESNDLDTETNSEQSKDSDIVIDNSIEEYNSNNIDNGSNLSIDNLLQLLGNKLDTNIDIDRLKAMLVQKSNQEDSTDIDSDITDNEDSNEDTFIEDISNTEDILASFFEDDTDNEFEFNKDDTNNKFEFNNEDKKLNSESVVEDVELEKELERDKIVDDEEKKGKETIDTDIDADIELDFDESDNSIEEEPIIKSEPIKEIKEEINRDLEPKDLRAFIRKHPRCEYDFAAKYFTPKQIAMEIKKGRVIRKGNLLKI